MNTVVAALLLITTISPCHLATESSQHLPAISKRDLRDKFGLSADIFYESATLTIRCQAPKQDFSSRSFCDGSEENNDLMLLVGDIIISKWICNKRGGYYYYELLFNEETILGDYYCEYRKFQSKNLPIRYRMCTRNDNVCYAAFMPCENRTDYCILTKEGLMPCDKTIEANSCYTGDNLYCPIGNDIETVDSADPSYYSHCHGISSNKNQEYFAVTQLSQKCPLAANGTPYAICGSGHKCMHNDPIYLRAADKHIDVVCGQYGFVECAILEAMEHGHKVSGIFSGECTHTFLGMAAVQVRVPDDFFAEAFKEFGLRCTLKMKNESGYDIALQYHLLLYNYSGELVVTEHTDNFSEQVIVVCDFHPPTPPEFRKTIWYTQDTDLPLNTTDTAFHLLSSQPSATMTNISGAVHGDLIQCFARLEYFWCARYLNFTESYNSSIYQVTTTTKTTILSTEQNTTLLSTILPTTTVMTTPAATTTITTTPTVTSSAPRIRTKMLACLVILYEICYYG